jgi:hypothetical protein
MEQNLKQLFNKEVPAQLSALFDFIDSLFYELEERGVILRWTKDKYFIEYGFYIDSLDKSRNLFVGLFRELWEYTGKPFCLALDWKKPEDNGIGYLLKDSTGKLPGLNASFIDYDGYPCLVFDEGFFKSDLMASSFVPIIQGLSERLQFNLYFNKKSSNDNT